MAAHLTDEGLGTQIDCMVRELADNSVQRLRGTVKEAGGVSHGHASVATESAEHRESIASNVALTQETVLPSEEHETAEITADEEPSFPLVDEGKISSVEQLPFTSSQETTLSSAEQDESGFAFVEEEISLAEEIPIEIDEEIGAERLLDPEEVVESGTLVIHGVDSGVADTVDTDSYVNEAFSQAMEGQARDSDEHVSTTEQWEVATPIEETLVATGVEEAVGPSGGEVLPLVGERTEEIESGVSTDKEETTAPTEEQSQREIFAQATLPQFRLENLVTPEMIERFRGETGELLDEAEQRVLQLEHSDNKDELIQALFRSIHTIKGNASFLNFERMAVQSETLENILDNLRSNTMPFTAAVTSLLLRGVDYIRRDLVSLGKGEEEEHVGAYKPIGEILVEMGAADKESVEQALLEKEKPIGEILVEKGVVTEETIEVALQKQNDMGQGATLGLQKREIRVDASKLDRLFDLMGELINAEAMVLHHPLIKNIEDDELQKSISHLTKISRELQEVTMETRMIPIEGLFVRMHRLVRDLSRKFAKNIEFKVSGQENEIDKNLIDQIADPLIHLLRNAVDHGIESPEERQQKGKPESGLVELSACYQGNEIWISVRDDGQGLDREKIITKAQAKNLLYKPAQDMTDNEVWRLVLLPGFSTKDEVSDVSGRGVGMDVVVKNMEKLRGQIAIVTERGKGITITMKIPLTMAILDGVVCRTGQTLFILPLADIVELFKPTATQLTRGEKNAPLISLRGEILPVLDMEEIFYSTAHDVSLLDRILIVVTSQERKMALAVDEILSSQQVVVKSLSDFIGRIEGIIGCSILNEGHIGFIVDVKGLGKRMFE